MTPLSSLQTAPPPPPFHPTLTLDRCPLLCLPTDLPWVTARTRDRSLPLSSGGFSPWIPPFAQSQQRQLSQPLDSVFSFPHCLRPSPFLSVIFTGTTSKSAVPSCHVLMEEIQRKTRRTPPQPHGLTFRRESSDQLIG